MTYASGQPTGLGSSTTYASQIAFNQLASVSNGQIVPPG
jgi:hypothetical protein